MTIYKNQIEALLDVCHRYEADEIDEKHLYLFIDETAQQIASYEEKSLQNYLNNFSTELEFGKLQKPIKEELRSIIARLKHELQAGSDQEI